LTKPSKAASRFVGTWLALMCLQAPFLAGCRKVGLTSVGAGFSVSQATWFEAEQTLFFFYDVSAEQGVSRDSALEIRYTTDDGDVPWKELSTLPQVHTHEKVDCGRLALCGSGSLRVAKKPRNVMARLRYHRDGATALEDAADTFIVDAREPHISRSYLVYGVFDASNTLVQWRGRHNFPGLDNMDAERLGLRRWMKITDVRSGTPTKGSLDAPEKESEILEPTPSPESEGQEPPSRNNPYLYAADIACTGFVDLRWPAIETMRRARNAPATLDVARRADASLCARATTRDATGVFTAPVFARKNAQTRAAFDSLVSPLSSNAPLRYLLAPCRREISSAHLDMQKQRLGLADEQVPDVCLDDVNAEALTERFAALLGDDVNARRAQGADMMAVVAFHHDETVSTGQDALSSALQAALSKVIAVERAKSSPRLTGAFVFDSDATVTLSDTLKREVLWCPAKERIRRLPNGAPPPVPTESQEACEVLPGSGTLLTLGPLSLGTIPILPTRESYLNFIKTYSAEQAGRMKSMTFLAPTRTAQTEVVFEGDYGQVTFRDGEVITATAEQAFSYCTPDDGGDAYRFRAQRTGIGGISGSPRSGSPLGRLPESHRAAPATTYDLGLAWDFPFLTRLQYEAVLSGAAKVFGAAVPFGVRNSASSEYGEKSWLKTKHNLRNVLVQCERFCTHPPFDSAGVYNVRLSWRDYYAGVCHAPKQAEGGAGQEGSPYDP
jgi:hypothetical protein